MVCSCCKGRVPHKHDKRNCPINPLRKKKDKKIPTPLEGLAGCTSIFKEVLPKKKTKALIGLADCNLFKRANKCSLCGCSGHNRRTCMKGRVWCGTHIRFNEDDVSEVLHEGNSVDIHPQVWRGTHTRFEDEEDHIQEVSTRGDLWDLHRLNALECAAASRSKGSRMKAYLLPTARL